MTRRLCFPAASGSSVCEKELRILIVNTHFPVFPGTGGHEFLNTTNLSRLSARTGLVSLVHRAEDLEKATGFSEAGVDLYLWKSPHLGTSGKAPHRPGWLPALHRVLAESVITLRAWPAQPRDTAIADLEFRNVSAPILTALSEGPWHVIIVVQSSSAATLDSLPRPLVSVLVMHDIRARVLDRQAQLSTSWWHRRRLTREARRYFRFERDYLRRYDLIVALSAEDAEWITKHYAPSRITVVPIPVDATYFAPLPDVAEHAGRIVFTGLMNHPPNMDAAIYFAREVFPAIRAEYPGAEFVIVGKQPSAEVLALATLDGVTVTGEVPDTRPYLMSAAVVVVPLRFGSGVRNKILEAWCMEKFIVSTSIGAEGLSYVRDRDLAIANDAATMSATVVRALRDPGYRDRLRYEGRTVARTTHDPDRIAAHYHRELMATAVEHAGRATPMRIALDMRWMLPGVAGGIEQLARAFLDELIAIDRFNRYVAVLPARTRHDFPFERTRNIRAVSLDSTGAHLRMVWRRLRRLLHARLRVDDWMSPEVERLRWLASLDAEIGYSFAGYIHPDFWPLRNVLVVPDIQHEYFPEFFTEQAVQERRRLYGDSVRRADHICAISEFTRQTLIERLHVEPERITTVHLAAEVIFTPRPAPDDQRVLRKYSLESVRYIFFPAHTWRHKNHLAAFRALRILRDKFGIAVPLICTGEQREAQPDLQRLIEKEKVPVRFLGYCERNDLPVLYRQAACLVFPSLFEGFGMPVLEAMACGCPVVCSDTTSLPEIAGDAALLIDPTNPDAIAEALARLLESPDLRGECVERGLHQAARFSWRRHTTETLRVFHLVHRNMRVLQ
jgi:glycosyltransferase involved in cell wall biosynthesis